MKSKYNNQKTIVDGIKFDSKKEATRYQELKLLQSSGKIAELRLQVPFMLVPATDEERAVKYIADFVYLDINAGQMIVEDVKGYRTDVYKLKRKLFKYRYPEYIFIES